MTTPRQVWICEETGRTYRTAQAARSAGYRHRKKLNDLAQISDQCDYIRKNATGVENMMNLFVNRSEEFWGIRMENLNWNTVPSFSDKTFIRVSTDYAVVDEKRIKRLLKVQDIGMYSMGSLTRKARTELLMLCFLRKSVSGVNLRNYRFMGDNAVEFTFETVELSCFPGLLAEKTLWLSNKAAMLNYHSEMRRFTDDITAFVQSLPDIEKIGHIIQKFEEALEDLRKVKDGKADIYFRNFKERWLRDNPAPVESVIPNLDQLSGRISNV